MAVPQGFVDPVARRKRSGSAPAAEVAEFTERYESHFAILRADTPDLLDRVLRIRYQVYCIENPFEDPARHPDGRETDVEDHRAAHVLLVHRRSGQDAGTARVIFPDGRTHVHPPMHRVLDPDGHRSFNHLPWHTTGEISRFAVPKACWRGLGSENPNEARLSLPMSACERQQLMPFITFGLLRGILGICLEWRLTHVVAVMRPSLIRLLGRFGLGFHPLGRLVEHHGLRQPCFACVDELIHRVRGEGNLLWRYASAEVLGYCSLTIAA